MSIRPVKDVLRTKATIEGAGVRLQRAFGFGDTSDFDPFLLLDDFRGDDPRDYARGFPWHPHRGIETVTYILEGNMRHRDSLGNMGIIGPGQQGFGLLLVARPERAQPMNGDGPPNRHETIWQHQWHWLQGASAPQHGQVTGAIGKLTISRLICGGNLINGCAHARDMIYLSELLKHYFTDEKIIQTLQICEENGINTIITGSGSAPLLKKYWDERGGKIQWIAEGHPTPEDLKTNIKASIDWGASAVYLQGVIGDRWLKAGHVDKLGECVEYIKRSGTEINSQQASSALNYLRSRNEVYREDNDGKWHPATGARK